MQMEQLLNLLKDGHARSIEMLAIELGTSAEDVRRQLEYLEHMRIVRRTRLGVAGCTGCGGENGCKGCVPEQGFQNMGELWEVL